MDERKAINQPNASFHRAAGGLDRRSKFATPVKDYFDCSYKVLMQAAKTELQALQKTDKRTPKHIKLSFSN